MRSFTYTDRHTRARTHTHTRTNSDVIVKREREGESVWEGGEKQRGEKEMWEDEGERDGCTAERTVR